MLIFVRRLALSSSPFGGCSEACGRDSVQSIFTQCIASMGTILVSTASKVGILAELILSRSCCILV